MSSTDSSTAPTMSMSAARAVFIKPQAFKESRAAAIAANLERKLKLPKNEEKSSVGDPSPPLHNPLPNVTSLKSKFERAPTRASAGSNMVTHNKFLMENKNKFEPTAFAQAAGTSAGHANLKDIFAQAAGTSAGHANLKDTFEKKAAPPNNPSSEYASAKSKFASN